MPEEKVDWGEFRAYLEWLKNILGANATIGIHGGNYKEMPEYAEWVRIGKPTAAQYKETWRLQQLPPEERTRDILTTLGGMRTPAGTIPNETLAERQRSTLQSMGWQLTTADEQGFPVAPFWSQPEPPEPPKPPLDLTEPMSEYQRATLEQGQAQWEAEQAFQREQFGLTERELALREAQARRGPEETYAQYKQRLLGELTGPRDWIKRWMVEREADRMAPKFAYEEASALQERAPTGGAPIGYQEWWEKAGAGEPITSQMPEPGAVSWTPDQIIALSKVATAWKKYEELSQQSQQPSLPPAPPWLNQFLTTGMGAGAPISPIAARTPSLQHWARTPWEQREGLAGYVDWASGQGGRTWQDILEQMERTAPETPYGAGRSSWAPARQV